MTTPNLVDALFLAMRALVEDRDAREKDRLSSEDAFRIIQRNAADQAERQDDKIRKLEAEILRLKDDRADKYDKEREEREQGYENAKSLIDITWPKGIHR
jgi:hypothetical protein